MNTNKVNCMSHDFLTDWGDALAKLRTDDQLKTKSVVLASRSSHIWCSGLDLKFVASCGRDDFRRFLRRLDELFIQTITHPTPVIAAIGGHALAGGMILALSCDVVVATAGDYKIGLSEVTEVGVPFPALPLEIVRAKLGDGPTFQEATLFSRMYSPEDALLRRIIQHIVPKEALLNVAKREATQIPEMSLNAFAATKNSIWLPSLLRTDYSIQNYKKQTDDAFLNTRYTEETALHLQKLLQKIAKK